MNSVSTWRVAADSRSRRRRVLAVMVRAIVLVAIALAIAPSALAQEGRLTQRDATIDASAPTATRFTSPADSVEWQRWRTRAIQAAGFRLIISLLDRQLWAVIGADTVLSAPIGVPSGTTLEYQGRRWAFAMPRGVRRVARKDPQPVWIPPEWHYYEVARARGLVVRYLVPGRPEALDDGRKLEVRGNSIGVATDSGFTIVAADEEIIFDGFLFIPPVGTVNRQVSGELGAYRLDLGNGYLLHGTPHQESIGQPTTHGCIRLGDADIAWLYEMVPIGTRVYIY